MIKYIFLLSTSKNLNLITLKVIKSYLNMMKKTKFVQVGNTYIPADIILYVEIIKEYSSHKCRVRIYIKEIFVDDFDDYYDTKSFKSEKEAHKWIKKHIS